MIQSWIAATRPRTLPVSASPVILASAYAWHVDAFNLVPALICLIFALLAQIASNLANDYFDYKKGTDNVSTRIGPRRAVASGDISPRAMLIATCSVLALASVLGCALICYGGWWLIVAGICIAVFALAYSAGPYPLSYHGLGDVAVFLFFGLVAVNLSYYVQAQSFAWPPFFGSMAAGLLAINVLLVNNYRDCEVDAAGGKRTTVVIFGLRFARIFYLLNGIIALACCCSVWNLSPVIGGIFVLFYLGLHLKTWRSICKRSSTALNPLLGKTALNQLLFILLVSLLLVLS